MTEFFSLLLSPFPLPLSSLLLLPVILVGHAFLWVAAINRIHATGWPRRIIGCWTIAMFLMLGLLPPAAIWWLIASAGADVAAAAEPRPLSMPCAAVVYALACCAGAVLAVSHWLRFHVFRRPPELLRSEREIAVDRGADCQSADSESRLGNLPHDASHFLTRLPCNEVLRLRVVEREIEVARLPAALDGLSDRPSLRPAPHRPRRPPLFRGGRADQQRAGPRPGRGDGRPRGRVAMDSIGFPTRWGACGAGTASTSSWATTRYE